MKRIESLFVLFFMAMTTVMASSATVNSVTPRTNGWTAVQWTPEDEISPESGLEMEYLQDKIILKVTGDRFITRVSGSLWALDVDINDNANPNKPVLAPSISGTKEMEDFWTGKSQQVEIPWSKEVVRELMIIMADEAAIEADNVVTLSHQILEIVEGEQQQLTATYTYEGVPQSGIVWSIDNADVAEIDSLGVLTALKEGTAKVTATTTDGRNLFATCDVTVKPKSVVMPGDVNGDGQVMVNDVVLAINAVLGQAPEGFILESADMNGDGQVMVNDVVLMINVVLGVTPASSSQVRQFLNMMQK